MRFLKKIFWNRYALIVFIVFVIIVFFVFRQGSATPNIEYATAKIADVVEKVSVTGKIMPQNKANLAFEKSGVVKSLPYKIGDIVETGSVIATLGSESDTAALQSAEAQLRELIRSLRPEEYSSDESAVLTASTSVANARQAALVAVRDSYVKAQGAILNSADSFFNNPQSANPTINILTQSSVIQSSINQKRSAVTEALQSWKNLTDEPISPEKTDTTLQKAEEYIAVLQTFMSDLSSIVSYLNPNNSALSQATINVYVSTLSTGLSNLNLAITSLNTAQSSLASALTNYDQAVNQFNVKLVGTSAENIAAQKAKVEQARAEVNKNKIISPINGILTKADPELGEYVRAGENMFTVQSNGIYKIEANVPEADIAKLTLGNKAEITLDAYSSNITFPATVTSIDPAETILEGVPTYKVTLIFDQSDNRIRSGMTANTDIHTRRRDSAVTVPTRAVTEVNGAKSVRILHPDGKTFDTVPVITGIKGSDGTLEIVSGLEEGQKVVTYIK
ncbi:MAG: efflux RND transporter periplasmic adaptor subunit [Candidatus Paceibacterota bacterium]